MNLRRIESDSDPSFALAIDLYESAFVPDERMDNGVVRQRMADGSRYELVEIVREDAFAGFAMLDMYEIGECRLLGAILYFAILPDLRGRGLGEQVYTRLFERFLSRCSEEGKTFCGMIYEVERPELAADEVERLLRERRTGFYQRMGGRVLEGIDYVQPSLGEGKEPVRMHLMHHPALGGPVIRDFELYCNFMQCAWSIRI